METEALAAASEADFSLLALFLRASLTVKVVMILLIFASIYSWGIAIQKLITFRRMRAESESFEEAFWSGEPLDKVYDQVRDGPEGGAEKIFVAGMEEWRRSHRTDGGLIAGAQARIDRAMNVALAREGEEINASLIFLASVSNLAPFVGLFGTVWGIKVAFQEIAIQQSTNLAVVAPGIAEALLATGLGLLAAIPAGFFYNKLSGDAEALSGRHEAFADEFSMILSRQLDQPEPGAA